MTELATQLRDYVDAVAAPVTLDDVLASGRGAGPGRRRRRNRIVAGVAVAAAAIAAAIVVAVSVSGSDDGAPRVQTVSPTTPAAVPLAAKGPADCAAVRVAGDTLLLATATNDGVILCATQRPGTTTVFLDGRFGMSTGQDLGSGFTSSVFGGTGVDAKGRVVFVGNLRDDAAAMRLSFCDGEIVDLHPLNSNSPRFVAAAVDTNRLGVPGTAMVDAHGGLLESYGPARLPGSGLGRRCPPASSPARGPGSVLTILDGQLVTVSGRDGSFQRMLTTIGPRTPGVTLATDGRLAYVDQSPPFELSPGTNVATSHIVRVDLGTGDTTDVAVGDYPALSPDGRFLAYASAPASGTPGSLVVLDVSTGTRRSWDLTALGGRPVVWERDSRHLVVRAGTAFRDLDTKASPTLGDAPLLARRVLDLRPLGATGRWAAVVQTHDPKRPRAIVEYDVVHHRAGRVLLRVAAGAQARNPSLNVQILDVDKSGRHALFVVFPVNGLYDWDTSTHTAHRILVTQLFAAGWIP